MFSDIHLTTFNFLMVNRLPQVTNWVYFRTFEIPTQGIIKATSGKKLVHNVLPGLARQLNELSVSFLCRRPVFDL